MSNLLRRVTALGAAMMASLVVVTTALAQMPTSPWKKGAPFPEPDEELYSVTVNGKLYVIGGWGDGKARGVNYEYDPATDVWTKKSPMPHPAHHAALAAANGKIYAFGGFVAPANTAMPVGAAWEPIADAWEFNPATDSWKSLAPLPGKRGSAIAAEVGGKIYVIGGATTMEGSKESFFTAFGPARVLGTNEVYDPSTNTWESRTPMSVPQSCLQRRRQRQDLRHGRPYRPRFHPVGHQHRRRRRVQPRIQHVEYPEGADADRSQRRRVGYGRPQDLCRRWRSDHHGARRRVSSGRGIRARNQFVDDVAVHADAASRRCRWSHRESVLSGERDDPVGGGAHLPRPDALHAHRGARHSGASVRDPADPADGRCEEPGAFPGPVTEHQLADGRREPQCEITPYWSSTF